MNSKIAVFALVVLVGAFSVNGNPASAYIEAKASQSLMKYMMQSRAAQIGGADSLVCFNYYIPVLNGITETYQKNYEACIKTANDALNILVEEGSESRENITASSNQVCSQFNECQAEADNLDFFDCYSNLGDESVRQVYNDSQIASIAGANYRETYRSIQVQSEKCTNETQRTYVTDTAQAYDDLDDCLANGLKTTNAPSTEEPSTEEPSTEEPSTEEPSTEEPSTEEPSTEEPNTDEPTTDEPNTDEPNPEEPAE